jgi:crossover junction endodeoxyribonuclease RuvC
MIALGIDPGFANLGLGVLEVTASSSRCLHHETFKTSPKDTDDHRLERIADRIFDTIDEYKPALLGFEDQAGVEAAIHRDDSEGTNYSSRRVHEVVGIVRAAARFYALPLYRSAPSTVKVAVLGKGGGHAKKARMIEVVSRIFGLHGCSEHGADALAIAVASIRKHRQARAQLKAAAALIH